MTNEQMAMQTRQALSNALKEAMLHKPLSKITVSDLVRRCDVNRNTFYYHFRDIYDLLKWTFEQEAIEVVAQMNLLLDTEDAIRFVLNYVDENKYIINCAFDHLGYLEMKRFFRTDFVGIMTAAVNAGVTELGIPEDPEFQETLVLFYTEALVGMILDFLQSRQPRNQDALIRNILFICKTSIPHLLAQHAAQPEVLPL